jgi:hypothetical protein
MHAPTQAPECPHCEYGEKDRLHGVEEERRLSAAVSQQDSMRVIWPDDGEKREEPEHTLLVTFHLGGAHDDRHEP